MYNVLKYVKNNILKTQTSKIEDKQNFTPLKIEEENQQYFAEQKRKGFFKTTSLRKLRKKICDYISDDSTNSAMIVHGPSGSGKSALMAHIKIGGVSKTVAGSIISFPRVGVTIFIISWYLFSTNIKASLN